MFVVILVILAAFCALVAVWSLQFAKTTPPSQTHSCLAGWLIWLQIHGAIGTAVGGCTTLVGEPQNLVIAKRLEWDFVTFVSASPKQCFTLVIFIKVQLLQLTSGGDIDQ